MGNMGIHWYVALSIIGSLSVTVAYIVYAYKRTEKNKQLLHAFFKTLSKTFESGWKLHYQDQKEIAEIVGAINGEIKKTMGDACKILFSDMHDFPAKGFKFFSMNQYCNNFIGNMFQRVQTLHDNYKTFDIPLDDLDVEFFTTTKKFITEEVKKEQKKFSAKQ